MPSHATGSTASTPSGALRPLRRHGVELVREQWIFAALLFLVWCGDTTEALGQGSGSALLVSGSTLMMLLALVGRRYPIHSGLLAAMTMAITTAAASVTHTATYSAGLHSILPTENAAGLLLILYVFWKRPFLPAVTVTGALVVSCMVALFLREGVPILEPLEAFPVALGFGFLQLFLAAGTGLYLRNSGQSEQDRPWQGWRWPVIAALSVLLFLDLIATIGSLPEGLLPLLGSAIVAGVAVFAPVRPVTAALLGSVVLVLGSLPMRLFPVPGRLFPLSPVPLTALASGMFLIAFGTRYAKPRETLGASAVLVGSALLLAVMAGEGRDGEFSRLAPSLLMGGLLLVLSLGTGMYFRAKDTDRARSVRTAVLHAQQSERMSLARELHDVVAHHVTGIVVQAQAAQAVADENPQWASAALERIAGSGAEALTAMRRLVRALRDTDSWSDATPDRATTDLEADLIALTAAPHPEPEHGKALRVELSVDLGREIPQEIARSALRVVQESLTNARKHAIGAGLVSISIYTTDLDLEILITDDGSTIRAQPLGGSGGYGLVGMRERVDLLGGDFSAGPGNHGGWRVRASLPLTDRRGDHGDPGTDRG